MSDILDDVANNRVANVRALAARVVKLAEGLSVRELLDALALAAGSLIRAVYRGPGIEIATKSFIEALIRAVQKG